MTFFAASFTLLTVNRLFALFAALALALSPMTASAESADCQMQAGQEAGQDMAMPMPMFHQDGDAKSSDPCCRHDKACATACGQICAPVAALLQAGCTIGVGYAVVRLTPKVQRELVSLRPLPARSPPRTTT